MLEHFLKAGALSRIERLLEEQNSLLRELVAANSGGRLATTPRARLTVAPLNPRTAADVTRVTREDVIAAEREEQAKFAAPWRDGPENVPTALPSGNSPSEDSAS